MHASIVHSARDDESVMFDFMALRLCAFKFLEVTPAHPHSCSSVICIYIYDLGGHAGIL